MLIHFQDEVNCVFDRVREKGVLSGGLLFGTDGVNNFISKATQQKCIATSSGHENIVLSKQHLSAAVRRYPSLKQVGVWVYIGDNSITVESEFFKKLTNTIPSSVIVVLTDSLWPHVYAIQANKAVLCEYVLPIYASTDSYKLIANN